MKNTRRLWFDKTQEPYPTAAPAVWPYNHMSQAEVMADESEFLARQRARYALERESWRK